MEAPTHSHEFKAQLPHLTPVHLWASYFTSLSCERCLYKMRIIMLTLALCKDLKNGTYKTPSIGPGTNKFSINVKAVTFLIFDSQHPIQWLA